MSHGAPRGEGFRFGYALPSASVVLQHPKRHWASHVRILVIASRTSFDRERIARAKRETQNLHSPWCASERNDLSVWILRDSR